MSFKNIELNRDIVNVYNRSTVFPVSINSNEGRENRNYNGPDSGQFRWRISFRNDTKYQPDKEAEQAIESHFINVRGPLYSFKFYDPFLQIESDDPQVIGVGDDIETDFQMVLNYDSGSYSTNRNIYKLAGTQKVYFDDVEQVSGWTADTATGIFSFTSPPSTNIVITAYSSEILFQVRFDMQQDMTVHNEASVFDREYDLLEIPYLEDVI